jgi:hypothetical protein
MEKKLLRADRQRKFPHQFSWIDQKLLKEKHYQMCSAKSLGLYLFLVIVGDSKGLSYYSDSGICKRLSISLTDLTKCRRELMDADLLAYDIPIYQVLSIPTLKDKIGITTQSLKKEGFVSVKDVFQTIGRKI